MIWKDPRKCGSFLRLSLPCQRQAPPLRGRWRVAPEGDLMARRAGGLPTGFPGNLNTPAAARGHAALRLSAEYTQGGMPSPRRPAFLRTSCALVTGVASPNIPVPRCRPQPQGRTSLSARWEASLTLSGGGTPHPSFAYFAGITGKFSVKYTKKSARSS